MKSAQEMIKAGALVVVNHSGGKDSQAMLIELLKFIPKNQMIVVHATLGEVEWPGALDHAKNQAKNAGIPFIVASAPKTFFEMVNHRHSSRPDVPSFPSASHRQCTSDLKTSPCSREIRRYMKANGYSEVVNCLGIRSEESVARSKKNPWKQNIKESVAGRTWMEWYPIFDMNVNEVFGTIEKAGQDPHWAYKAGNERLSCIFCIMASARDLRNGAKHNPALLNKYIELEEKTGYTMHMSRKPLAEIVMSDIEIEARAELCM